MGNATHSLFLLPSLPLPFHPSREAAPCGVREAPAAYAFWCILSSKIAAGGNIFFTNALRKNNSCIGKKCRNDVQKFTPTKISGENLEFPRGEFPPPPPATGLEETLLVPILTVVDPVLVDVTGIFFQIS